MQLLLDNVVAAIVATIIILMLVTGNQRNQRLLTDTTAFYVLMTQSEEFASILRRDLQGIERVLMIEPETQPDGSTDFTFQSRIGNDTTRREIKYTRRLATTRTFTQRYVDGSVDSTYTVSFYKIERYVDNVLAGGSQDIISEWNIIALSEDAGSISDPDNAAQVFVQFEAMAPFADAGTVQSTTWESRFYPPLRN